MGEESKKSRAIEFAARKIELIAGLRRAIDRNYRRLRQAARADWERLFVAKDAVNVAAQSSELAIRKKSLPGSGFLKVRKPADGKGKRSLPRFAHRPLSSVL